MRRFLLLFAAVFLSLAAFAAEELKYQCLFGKAYNSEGVQNYTSTWKSTNDEYVWSVVNFSNNYTTGNSKNNWTYVRCGAKNTTNGTASITSQLLPAAVSKVSLKFSRYNNTKSTVTIHSVVLESSVIGDFTDAVTVGNFTTCATAETGTPTTEDLTIDAPTENLYYRLTVNYTIEGTTNGALDIYSISYYSDGTGGGSETLSFDKSSVELTYGDVFTAPTLSNADGLTINWSSSNTDVATVDGGNVSIVGIGTTTITATDNADNTNTASYTITVSKKYIFADTYAVLVSDVNDLQAGDVIIIANQDASVAMSTADKDNNFGQTAVTLSEDKSTISSIGGEVLLIELEKSGDYWLFKTLNRSGTNGYLLNTSLSSNNYLKTVQTVKTDNPLATIAIAETGVATVKFNKGGDSSSSNRNWLRYNNTASLFSCYGSGQADVYIYKLVTPEFKADITIAVDETEGGANVVSFSNLGVSNGVGFNFTGYKVYLNGTEIGGTTGEPLSYLPFLPTAEFTISNDIDTYPIAVKWPITDFSTIKAKVTEAKYFAYCDEEHTVTGYEDGMWYLDAEYTIAPDCEVSNLYCEMTCTLFDPDNELGSTVEKKGNNIVCVNRVGMFMLGDDPTFETDVNGSFNVTLTFPFYVQTALKGMMLPAYTEKITSFEGVETLIDVTALAGQVPQPGDEGGKISGVESVVVDSECAVEYYNLQGVRVEGALTPGIYIRRTATGTSKVAIR